MEKIDLYALRIAEFLALGTDVDTIIANYDATALGLAPEVATCKAGFKKASDLYAREKGSPISKEIDQADLRRDDCIIGIKGVAENYLRYFDPAFKSAADIVLRTINKYGSSIATQNYLAESESLRQLCDDLEAPGAAKNAIAKLGLTAWVAEMRAANIDFAALYQKRNKETSQQPTGNLKELRASAKLDFEALMAMIDARKLVSPSTSLNDLINELNTLIGKYNRLLASRRIFGGDDDAPLPPAP